MRKLLLATVAVGLMAPAARAQLVVVDPTNLTQNVTTAVQSLIAAEKRIAMIKNQIDQLRQIENTVNALAHGNLSALGDVVPELNASGLMNPMGDDTQTLMQALGGTALRLGDAGAAAQQVLNTDQFYMPRASDFRAASIAQSALAAAQQKALAAQMMQASHDRLVQTQRLRVAIETTPDAKASGDATLRMVGEGVQTQAQTNQLLATMIMQRAQEATERSRDEQAWRCSAEQLVSQATAASGAADGGQVQLVGTGGDSGACASTGPAAPSPAAAYAASTSVNLGAVNLAAASPASGSPLDVMLNQSWGQAAADNARAMGVNPTALAATCVIESNCSTNVGGSGTISGAFQISDGTYGDTVNAVRASNPNLASQITTKNDPISQSISASQYLKQGAQTLQASGIADPTNIDVRGYYQFGPANAASLARASDNQIFATAITGLSPKTLAANGITETTTVGQWKQTVSSKLGSAAGQSVLLGNAA